mgnify:CR=1 FL=1
MMDERITVKSRWHRPGDPSIARVMAGGARAGSGPRVGAIR